MDTTVFQDINWLATIVAAICYFLLGAIWYTALFGKRWQTYNAGLMQKEDAKKGAAGIMIFSFILMLICAIGLSLIVARFGLNHWLSGLKLGLITGICFAGTGISISYLYEKRPAGLHLINVFYNVLGNVIAGIIICVWR